MEAKLYFDEAGYTGADLVNKEQPYFVLASVRFTDAELDILRSDLQLGPKELHFKKMYGNEEGRKTIEKILSHPLLDKEHVKLGAVNKRYCIYAQMVNILYEEYCHEQGMDLYHNKVNICMADVLYSFATIHENQNLIKDFEDTFVSMVRGKGTDIEDFFLCLSVLMNDKSTSAEFRTLLEDISLTYHVAETDLPQKDRFYLDNTSSLFFSLLQKWYTQTKEKDNVLFDASKPIAEHKHFLEQLRDMPVDETLVGYDTRKHILPLPVGKIDIVDSKMYLGIQIADVIASAVVFRLTNKTKRMEPFRKKLEGYELLNRFDEVLEGHTIKQLKDVPQSTDDINPLDFICEHMD